MIIVAFSSAVISVNYSLSVAKSSAREKAEEVKELCLEIGCPPKIHGWHNGQYAGYPYYTLAGALVKYPLLYYPSEDLSSFKIAVRVNIDEAIEFKLLNGKIVVEHFE